MREPAFARAAALCRPLAAAHGDAARLILGSSSTFNALNAALIAGSKPEDLVMLPPVVADPGVDPATLQRAVSQTQAAGRTPPANAAAQALVAVVVTCRAVPLRLFSPLSALPRIVMVQRERCRHLVKAFAICFSMNTLRTDRLRRNRRIGAERGASHMRIARCGTYRSVSRSAKR